MHRFLMGFVYAGRGIVRTIRCERNMRFHLCAAVWVYLLSLFYEFDAVRYCILTMLVAGVFALEAVNSAVERAVDSPDKEHWQTAGYAKDMAAGAVLLWCMGCVACAVWLFWDIAVFAKIFAFFTTHIWLLMPLVVLAVGCVLFVFHGGKREKEEE